MPRPHRPRVDTHGRWPLLALAAAGPTWGLVVADRRRMLAGDAWVGSLGLPILLTHQSEEWVRPGGFLPFCNERLLGSAEPTWPLTERLGFHVNVTLGWGSAAAALALRERAPGPVAFLLAIEAGNALMHTAIALRERRYNPGLATAATLMAAHSALGARRLVRSPGSRSRAIGAGLGVAFSVALPTALRMRMARAARAR